MNTPSITHNNKQSHNWLFYKLNDEFLKKHSSLYRGTLYDLGCGQSPYLQYFSQYVHSYIGVDWQQNSSKKLDNIIADLNDLLPIPENVADTVVSFSVLEHLYNPQTMLSEAYRILKPSGHLIMQVPWQWAIHESPHDYFRYTHFGLNHLLKKAGFDDIHIESQAGYFTTRVLKFNYFSMRFAKKNKLFRFLLLPIWFIGQKLAPFLDKLDRNWQAETIGYFVVA